MLQCECSVYPGVHGGPKKPDTPFYFWDNFGNSAPILTILLLLQAEICVCMCYYACLSVCRGQLYVSFVGLDFSYCS